MADETQLGPAPPLWQSLPRVALRIAIVIAIALLLREAYAWFADQVKVMDVTAQARAMAWLAVIGVAIYALLIAVPFVPAIEIGVALLVMDGAAIAPFVYVATVLGLLLAYFVGRRVSLNWLQRVFHDMHMVRACQMLERIKHKPPSQRLTDLHAYLPRWIAPIAVQYRYLTLAALLNVPGNAVIGGGGGIMMVAGVSRLFGRATTVLTVMLAVAPVPLAVWWLGAGFLS